MTAGEKENFLSGAWHPLLHSAPFWTTLGAYDGVCVCMCVVPTICFSGSHSVRLLGPVYQALGGEGQLRTG